MSKRIVYTLLSTGTFIVIASTSIASFAQTTIVTHDNYPNSSDSIRYSSSVQNSRYSSLKTSPKQSISKNNKKRHTSAIQNEIQQAIINEDWRAYQNAIAALPNSGRFQHKITLAQNESEFKQLVLKHQLRSTIRQSILDKDWDSYSAAYNSMKEMDTMNGKRIKKNSNLAKLPTTEEEFNIFVG